MTQIEWTFMLARFRAFQIAAGLGERTIESRETMLTTLAERTQKLPSEIEYDDLVEFLGRPHARKGGPLAPGTKQVERSYLQVWGRWAVDEGYLTVDPARRLPKVRMPRREARPLELVHIAAMLNQPTLWQSTLDMITIGANTGLRVSEIAAIHGSDFDPYTGTIRSIRKGGITHYVQCPPAVLEIAQRMPPDGWWFPSGYRNKLFPDGGGHILGKSASTRICTVMRRVGITDPKLTAHSLRHFYCCLLIAQGVPLHVVQEMMGHASLATTQLYMRVTQHELDQAVATIPTIGPSVQGIAPRLAA